MLDLSNQFRSNFTDRINISQECAYYILVRVYQVFTELLPFDEMCTGHSRSISSNKEQFLSKYLLWGIHHFSDVSNYPCSAGIFSEFPSPCLFLFSEDMSKFVYEENAQSQVLLSVIYKAFENVVGPAFLLFIHLSKTGRIMLSPVAGGRCPPFFVRSISPRLC